MANNKNLLKGKDTQFKAGEQQAKVAAEGGKQLGINNRKRKSYEELFNTLMSVSISKKQTIVIYEEDEETGDIIPIRKNLVEFIKNKYPAIPHEEIDNCIFATMRMIELINHPKPEVAMKAFELVRDTSGQRPDSDKAKNIQNNFFGEIADKVGEATKDLINVTPTERKKKNVYDLI